MRSIYSDISQALTERKSRHLLRNKVKLDTASASTLVVNNQPMLNFSSNDYLGLASDFDLTAFDNWLKQGQPSASSGAMSSPLVTGSSAHHHLLTESLRHFLSVPEQYGILLFSSGFSANQAVLNTLFTGPLTKGLCIQDKLNHASLIDTGHKLQQAKHLRQVRFKHNDVNDLEKKLILSEQNVSAPSPLVITEGIFSMDGDAAPLAEMSQLCRKKGALLMVDDAHGIGINGSSLHRAGIDFKDVDIYIGTFGKAIGAQGAALIADQRLIDYFINFCKEYIYSTHIAPLQAATISFNLSVLNNEQQVRNYKLEENIRVFKTEADRLGIPLIPSNSAIQPIIIGDEAKAIQIAKQLKGGGIWLNAMRYPTVKKGQSRLRVTLSCKHNTNDIKRLLSTVKELLASSTLTSMALNVKPKNVAKHFDSSANTYKNHAQLQFDVGAKLITLLQTSAVNKAGTVGLDLGCGPGLYHSTLKSMAEYVVNIDLSEAMLQSHASKDFKVCADSHQLPIQSLSLDWVYSNLMIQWCDIKDVLAELHRCLKPGGVAVISTLMPGSLYELAQAWAKIDDDKHVHEYQSDLCVREAISFNNWERIDLHDQQCTYWFNNVRGIAQELKGLGANYVENRKRKGLMGKSTWKALESAYHTEFYCADNEGIPASYQVRTIKLTKAKFYE